MTKITYTPEFYGIPVTVTLRKAEYLSGGTCIEAFNKDGEPWAFPTVWLDCLMPGYAYMDVNNCPDLVEAIRKAGIAKPTGKTRSSGFCSYPLYEFDEEALAAIDEL